MAVDDELTAQFREALGGDGNAYRRFLTTVTPQLRGLARRGLARAGRSPDESEDIVQETLLALHVKRHTWNPTEPVGPWVRAIATYKLVDVLRRRGSHGHVDIDDVADAMPAAPDADVVQRIDRERLLSALPARQRQIVEGMALEGRSAREVGDALGMTEGAVRVVLHRALKAMGDAFRRGST